MDLQRPTPARASLLQRTALPVLILAFGAFSAWYFMASKPSARRSPPPPSSPVVMTAPVEKGRVDLSLTALGTVKPAQQTVIRSQVAGTVVDLAPHFEAGGQVKAGDVLVRIDPATYENTLRLKESALARARADYELEMGQQAIARAEFETLNKTMPERLKNSTKDGKLALRVPHLAQAKADLSTAETNVRQARLDLERTQVSAPYNALVTDRQVSLGSQATQSENLGTLVGTDEYRVEAALPLDRLHALGFTRHEGLPARVVTGTGQTFEGSILHTLGNLDGATRMGRVVVSVPDPLGLKSSTPKPPLLLGDQVQVRIASGKLDDVAILPRAALRGGDKVWVVNESPDGPRLDIRPVGIVWRDADNVYIDKGLASGEKVITSDIGNPMQNMALRLAAERGRSPAQPATTPPAAPAVQQADKTEQTS